MLSYLHLAGEILLVSLTILFLYRLKPRFGLAPLYIFIGSNQFIQTILTSTVYFPIFDGYLVSPGSVVLFASSLFAVLLIYIKEDVPQTRVLIYGIVFSNFTLTAFSLFTHYQLLIGRAVNLLRFPEGMFEVNTRLFLVATGTLFLDSVLIVVVYEFLFFRVRRLPLFGRIVVALTSVLYFDAVLFNVGGFQGHPLFRELLVGNLVGRTFSGIVFGATLYGYLMLSRTNPGEFENDGRETSAKRGIFSILTYREKYELVKTENAMLEAEIARRKHAEAALRESEERYRRVVETSPDAVAVFRNGRLVFANSGFARMVGVSSIETLIGKSSSDFAVGLPNERSLEYEDRSSYGDAPGERQLWRHDGTTVEVEILATRLTFEDAPAVQIVFRDITKRKEMEVLKDQYTKLVVAQKDELAQVNEKLQELDRLKTDFTAMLVHDLKSPLSVVMATLEILRDPDWLGPEETASLVKTSERNLDKVLGMINEMLELSRSESREMRMEFDVLDSGLFLTELAEEARLSAASRQVSFEADLPADLPFIRADRKRLERVFSNLLSNAIKFTPAGGVIRIEARPIAGSGVETGVKFLLVAVTDSGEGIPLEDLPFIFDPYRQSKSSKRMFGVGLGLAIAQRIVAAHGGKIDVRSQVGIGTSFRVLLPIESACRLENPTVETDVAAANRIG